MLQGENCPLCRNKMIAAVEEEGATGDVMEGVRWNCLVYRRLQSALTEKNRYRRELYRLAASFLECHLWVCLFLDLMILGSNVQIDALEQIEPDKVALHH